MAAQMPDFLIIPGFLYQADGIDATDRDVYGIIYWCAKLALKKCTMSNASIAEMLRVHPRSVSRSVSKLAAIHAITVVAQKEKGNKREIVPNLVYTPIHTQVNTYTHTGEQNKNIEKERTNTNVLVTLHKQTNKNTLYTELREYCQKAQGFEKGFTNIPKQHKALKAIFDAGYSVEEIKFVIDQMAADTWWQEHTFDLLNVQNRMTEYLNRTIHYRKGDRKYAN